MKGLVLTYVIAAAASVGALRFPLIGLYVYVAFAVLRPQAIFGWAGDISYVSLVVGAATLAGWAFQGFGSWRFGRARPIVLALLAFTAWFAVSAAFAQVPSRGFDSLSDWSKIVLPFLVGVTMMTEPAQWRPLLWTIVLAQGYVGFEQNLNYVTKGFNTAADGFGGMDNNCFGVSLVTLLGPAMALAISSKSLVKRALAAVAAALILHTTLLTFSRGAMVGLIAMAIVAFVMMPKRPRYMGGLLIAVIVAVRLTGPQLLERYGTVFAPSEERDASSESRLDLWRDCLKVIVANPLLGVGPANWQVVAARYGWPEGKSAHSVWMETGAELGVPGTLILMFFFGSAAVRLWPLARATLNDANRDEVALAAGVVLATVGFAVAGQFVSVPGLEVPYYIVMVGAAMLRAPLKSGAETASGRALVTSTGARAVTSLPTLQPARLAPVKR
jgi:probable O-glycosylation ligase (exosortase A-associated)